MGRVDGDHVVGTDLTVLKLNALFANRWHHNGIGASDRIESDTLSIGFEGKGSDRAGPCSIYLSNHLLEKVL